MDAIDLAAKIVPIAIAVGGVLMAVGAVINNQRTTSTRLDGQARRHEDFEKRMRAVELSIAEFKSMPETLRRIEGEIMRNDEAQSGARHALRNDLTKTLAGMSERLDALFQLLAQRNG